MPRACLSRKIARMYGHVARPLSTAVSMALRQTSAPQLRTKASSSASAAGEALGFTRLR